MKILGIIKSSLIDYPKKASTVIFLGGCNFRCGFCHNPEIVYNKTNTIIEIAELFEFLDKRKRFIDAVCISGGEPTIHPSLVEFIKEIKDKGFAVKLDTNGTNPEMLKSLLEQNLIDYVAMDIKGPFEKYKDIVRCDVDIDAVRESAELLISNESEDFDYEFRTTVVKELLNESDLDKMIKEHPGAKKWYLQTFINPGSILDQDGIYSAYTKSEMEVMGKNLCVNVR
ncbi:MAG: anaerobic ribonucleoside-triphosphate reductase activating protein [Clostridiales bacterium]|nr:anaerobic ribonucleoside-triphosphate reductase activating protein [Clostridiales bacterium]